MTVKNDVQVVIDGRVITLSGYESNEYMQKLSTYINDKIKEFNENENYRRQNYDLKHIMLELNLADDFFKAKRQVELKQEEFDSKDKELYDLKHELIAIQLKLENTEKTLTKTKKQLSECQKNNVRLETELKTIKPAPAQEKK